MSSEPATAATLNGSSSRSDRARPIAGRTRPSARVARSHRHWPAAGGARNTRPRRPPLVGLSGLVPRPGEGGDVAPVRGPAREQTRMSTITLPGPRPHAVVTSSRSALSAPTISTARESAPPTAVAGSRPRTSASEAGPLRDVAGPRSAPTGAGGRSRAVHEPVATLALVLATCPSRPGTPRRGRSVRNPPRERRPGSSDYRRE